MKIEDNRRFDQIKTQTSAGVFGNNYEVNIVDL